MENERRRYNWKSIFKFFADENGGRLTRLGVFEGGDDYWIESGLPLTGIVVDERGELPAVEIVLGDYTHTVRNAMEAKIVLSHSGEEDGLDIKDSAGATTILRFEDGGR